MTDAGPVRVQDDIVWLLDTTFSAWNWAHKSMLDAVKKLTVEEAVWRPSRRTHSVWEQMNHVAHWKAYVAERIRGNRPRAHQAWPPARQNAGDLHRSISRLMRLHRGLRRAVLDIAPDRFAQTKIGRYSLIQLLLGAAAHESYHAGQILLTRKLYRDARRGK